MGGGVGEVGTKGGVGAELITFFNFSISSLLAARSLGVETLSLFLRVSRDTGGGTGFTTGLDSSITFPPSAVILLKTSLSPRFSNGRAGFGFLFFIVSPLSSLRKSGLGDLGSGSSTLSAFSSFNVSGENSIPKSERGLYNLASCRFNSLTEEVVGLSSPDLILSTHSLQ